MFHRDSQYNDSSKMNDLILIQANASQTRFNKNKYPPFDTHGVPDDPMEFARKSPDNKYLPEILYNSLAFSQLKPKSAHRGEFGVCSENPLAIVERSEATVGDLQRVKPSRHSRADSLTDTMRPCLDQPGKDVD